MLCGRYVPSHAGHGSTLGESCCRTCRAPAPRHTHRPCNQTLHAHAACCVGVTFHRMRVTGVLWESLAVGRAVRRTFRRKSSGSALLSDAPPLPSEEQTPQAGVHAGTPGTADRRDPDTRPAGTGDGPPPPPPPTEIDPTPEGARRRPTAPARSKAEPRTCTAARPPASAATRSRPPLGTW